VFGGKRSSKIYKQKEKERTQKKNQGRFLKMRKFKLSFSLILAFFLVGMFTIVASAAETSNPTAPAADKGADNANQSGVGVDLDADTDGKQDNNNAQVLKSDGMTNADGEEGYQRAHGEYHNNTNSCASCHQTHTAASKMLLFKDGVYATCAACHDGTLGFYNVFENGNHKASAGTFGGTTEGNSSIHQVNGTVKISAAPGGYSGADTTKGGKWTADFNCASCHAPHGSYSDRLLHYNPNGMAAATPENGGQKADKVLVFDFKTGLDYSAEFTAAAVPNTKFIGVRGTKVQHGLTGDKYTAINDTEDVIMIYETTATTVNATTGAITYAKTYKKTTNPWMYGYPTRGSGANNHYYYTRFFTDTPSSILNGNGTYPAAKADKVIDHYDYLDDTAHLKYSLGLVYAETDILDGVKYAEVARPYVVKLDLMPIATTVGGADDSDGDGWKDFGGIKITTVNQRAFFAGETHSASTSTEKWGVTPGSKVSGWGIAMSNYCSSCHADYLAGGYDQTAANGGAGVFTKSYRHSTNSDSYTCVRCHFAHGTDVEIMRDAFNRTITQVSTDESITTAQATAYMLDKNTSSALKRYTNMSVCWGCHTSSRAESLKNTDSYKYDGTAHYDPRGLDAIEGAQNWPTVSVPAAPSVTADDTNNVITGLNATMEYSTDGGATYTKHLNGAKTPVFTGAVTVLVRVAAVDEVNAAGATKSLSFTE
jgi:predicted CXXCH cytochrome family protein